MTFPFRLRVTTAHDTQYVVEVQDDRDAWLPIAHWHTDPLPKAKRAAAISDEAAKHGWSIDAAGGKVSDDATFTVTPTDWQTVLSESVEHRHQALDRWNAIDRGLRALVYATPTKDSPGLGINDVAEITGHTRHWVYKIKGVGRQPGEFDTRK